MNFKPFSLMEAYRNADAAVASAAQMNLMALQSAQLKSEYEEQSALKALTRKHDLTTESGQDGYLREAMTISPKAGFALQKHFGDARKAAVELANAELERESRFMEIGQARVSALEKASAVPFIKYRELVDSGLPDDEARAQVQPLWEAGIQNLRVVIPEGGLFKDGQGKIVPFNIPPQFDPAHAEQAMIQAQGVAKAWEQYRESKKPLTGVAKLRVDLEAGRIDRPTYDAAIAKETKHPPAPAVVVGTGESEYVKERGKGMAKSLSELEEKVPAMLNMVKAAKQIRSLSEGGAMEGSLAQGAVGAQQFLTSLGIKVAPEKLKDTRALDSVINQLVLDTMAQSGGARGFTEKETEILKSAFPKIADDAASRIAIAEIIDGKVREGLQRYVNTRDRELRAYPSQGMLGDTTLVDSVRAELKAKAPKGPPRSFENLPNAAEFKGKRVRGEDGTVFKSDGHRWVKQ